MLLSWLVSSKVPRPVARLVERKKGTVPAVADIARWSWLVAVELGTSGYIGSRSRGYRQKFDACEHCWQWHYCGGVVAAAASVVGAAVCPFEDVIVRQRRLKGMYWT